MVCYNLEFTDKKWIEYQLDFLEGKHIYYTETAQNIRYHGKRSRIKNLKQKLLAFQTTE